MRSLLDRSELDPLWVQSCDVVHVSGYCLLREPMAEAAIHAAALARRVTVDLASARDIEIVGTRQFTERLRALGPDLAFATEPERVAVPDFDATWRSTISPTSTVIGACRIGPAYTNVWNSPFPPQGSTPDGRSSSS